MIFLPIGFLILVIRALWRMSQGQDGQLVSLIVQLVVLDIARRVIPWGGEILAETSCMIGQDILRGTKSDIWDELIAKTSDAVNQSTTMSLGTLATTHIISFILTTLGFAMILCKMLIIDFLWPMLVCLVLIMAYIRLVLSVFFGTDVIIEWIQIYIEIVIWPVVFAVLAAFSLEMLRLAGGLPLVDGVFWGEMNRWDFIVYCSFSILYCMSTISTPLLARWLTRTTFVGEVAALFMAPAVGFVRGLVSEVRGGNLAIAASAMFQGFLSGGTGRGSVVVVDRDGDDSFDLDTRGSGDVFGNDD